MREWHEESEESAPDFISRRVLSLLKERKVKLAPFARGLGIDPALFRRFLKGKRRWRMDYLEKVAEGFGMSPGGTPYRAQAPAGGPAADYHGSGRVLQAP
jgi:transcriptional regulator with XRE-family HTH domain